MATKKPSKAKRKDTKELIELKKAVEALNAVQHNPVAWGSVIAFIAPIIGRLAVRYTIRYIASKTGRKYKKQLVDETAEMVADKISEAASKIRYK